MRPPYGLRNLFITCHDPEDPQFRSLGRLLRRVALPPPSHVAAWEGDELDLSRRRVLGRVLISGHGNDQEARFAAPRAAPLEPRGLRLPPACRLYLLGCSQGRPQLLSAWAEGAGIPVAQTSGCPGETDTAVSTCLVLHLLEGGVDSLERWFPVWIQCNEALRPHFPEIRRSYVDHGGDPVRTLNALAGRLDLKPFTEFLAVINRHPEYLRGLVGQGPDAP